MFKCCEKYMEAVSPLSDEKVEIRTCHCGSKFEVKYLNSVKMIRLIKLGKKLPEYIVRKN